MKNMFAVFVMVAMLFGVAAAKDYEVKKKAGTFEVEVRIDRNPPVVGDNHVSVEIRDAAGKDVTDAKVLVDYSMPAMQGMPRMNYKADAELKGNIYKADMNLSMSGPWNIAIKITREGKTSTMKFTVDAK
jgi:nitrogen fixation protein FixH